MEKKIRLLYRKIINSKAATAWDKQVWQDTYQEFRMQAQTFAVRTPYRQYAELLQYVPGAGNIPFLVSSALTGHLKQLAGIVPDIVNTIGNTFLPFQHYKFEILASDILDQSAHSIAVSFISEPLIWHDTIQNTLVVSIGGNKDANDGAWLTDMVTLQPSLHIFSMRKDV